MNQIYFEAKGEALLGRIGMSKSEFARRMGIRKQNVKALFKSKNLETIYKAAGVMGVPFVMLVSYIEEPDLSEIPIAPFEGEEEITEDGIPTGDTSEDVVKRRSIISNYYREWKLKNPLQRRFNISLKEYINIRFVSITETCTHASRSYLSTLAVLQLDAILTGAKTVATVPAKKNQNQKEFEKMLIMQYHCPGIGTVKMTVGVKRKTHEKVQYCITALEA
jgi:transcriptional regulator with XRE-family HTH domain